MMIDDYLFSDNYDDILCWVQFGYVMCSFFHIAGLFANIRWFLTPMLMVAFVNIWVLFATNVDRKTYLPFLYAFGLLLRVGYFMFVKKEKDKPKPLILIDEAAARLMMTTEV